MASGGACTCCRALVALKVAAAWYEKAEAFHEAAQQHHLAATAAHAANSTADRDAHASACLRLMAAADAAVSEPGDAAAVDSAWDSQH